VLESPFGALPYFWAIGHLSARACQTGAVVPFGGRGLLTSWPAKDHAVGILKPRQTMLGSVHLRP
jgi:hypothetical protein